MGLRQEKIQSLFQREITDIVQFSIKDPKLGFVTISEVQVTNDLSYAKVYVSFLGKEERNEAGLKVLNNAKGYIRSELAKRVKVYKVPELKFVLDKNLENAKRIEDIIKKINS